MDFDLVDVGFYLCGFGEGFQAGNSPVGYPDCAGFAGFVDCFHGAPGFVGVVG